MLRYAQHEEIPCPPEHSEGPVWKGIEMLRYAQHDRGGSLVTLSRSEGPVWKGVEMLRYAQHDRVLLSP